MLEDGRQGHQRFPLQPRLQGFAVRRAVRGFPGQDLVDRFPARPSFVQANVEAGLAIEAFLERDVVAGKLELVGPAQLQVDDFQRLARDIILACGERPWENGAEKKQEKQDRPATPGYRFFGETCTLVHDGYPRFTLPHWMKKPQSTLFRYGSKSMHG